MATHNRFNTPRVYTDLISFNLATGWSDFDDITTIQDDGSTAVAFDSGSESSMFDMKPANYAQIAHTNQAFYIQFNTSLFSNTLGESNFLAILGHNFLDAQCMFKVQISDDASMSSGVTTISSSSEHDKIINATQSTISGNTDFIEVDNNGWTLITWTTITGANQYVRITFKDTGGASASFNSDVAIGSIMYGEYFDFPKTPDLDIKTSINYPNVKVQKSLGGNSFSNASSLCQPSWYASIPFGLDDDTSGAGSESYYYLKKNGRVSHEMSFSYLTDTDVFSEDWHSTTPSKWFDTLTIHNSFYQKTIGSHLPFLFTIDKESQNEGDYGIFRLVDNGFSVTQVASQVYNLKLKIEESW
jgi:hypothetical protein